MNFNVKMLQKTISPLRLLLTLTNLSCTYLRESSNIKKIILCHFNLYSFNFGKSKGKYPRRNLCQINFGKDQVIRNLKHLYSCIARK
jgi:hypothetical protein